MISAPRPASHAVYRRRRFAAGLAAAGSLTLCGLGARSVLADPSGAPASPAGARDAPAEHTVVATAGDSLWSIARTAHRADPGADRRADGTSGAVAFSDYLDAVVELNGGAQLHVGDDVLLP